MVSRWSQTVFDGELLRRAGRVVDEAARLSMAGRRDEAAATGEHGLQMVREIAGRSRVLALPLLVRATCGQSWYLAETAQYSAALELAEEALSLARTADDIQLLAPALLTSASRLLESGRPQEALRRSRELVELPHLRSDARLARDLSTLSMSLTATGQHAEALHFSEQALGMWRALAAEQPSLATNAEYGRTLHNHANRLYTLGHWAQAAEAATEAVAFYRAMPGENRLDRLAKLALALDNCATFLSRVRRHDEALAAAEEAVTISRTLVAAEPGHRARLASTLRTYAARLATLDQSDVALEVLAESLAIYRELAAEERGAHLSRLAETISDLAFLSDTGDALTFAQEAVQLRRELVADNRAVQLPGLALSLCNLARKQADAGQLDAALETGDESVRLIREAAQNNRLGVLPRYAFLVREQADRLDRAGRAADALELGEEAVKIAREALGTHRAAGLGGLADALLAHAQRLATGPGQNKRSRRQARELTRQADRLLAERDTPD